MSKFTNAFKAKVAIEAIKETATVQELAKRYEHDRRGVNVYTFRARPKGSERVYIPSTTEGE